QIMDRYGTKVKSTDSADYFKVQMESDSVTELIDVLRNRVQIIQYAHYAPGFFLLGLLSIYDGFLSNIIKDFFTAKPAAMNSSEKTLTYKQILEMGDLNIVREHILEKRD